MNNPNKTHLDKQYKVLSFLSMLYITIIICANLLIYKLTHLGSIVISAGTFIIPFWYTLGDIIAEVYGYQIARRLIWQSIICTLIFSLICTALIHLPAPLHFKENQAGFEHVLGHLLRIFLGMLLAVIIGSFLNAFILAKWKVLVYGRLFFIRSLGSSALGQFCFTFISLFFDLYRIVPLHTLLELVTISYVIKLIFTPLAAIPSAFVAAYLKRFEGINIYDTHTNFNPFRLRVTDENEEKDALLI